MFVRRLAAAATIGILTVRNLVACAGWQPAPEARMACCKSGTSCPMHPAETQDSGTRIITQSEADSCCAGASNRTQSPAAASVFTLSTPALLPAAVSAVIPVTVLALQEWRVLGPRPISPVPKHLLLSVLLI